MGHSGVLYTLPQPWQSQKRAIKRAGRSQKYSSDNAISNGPREKVEWGSMPEEIGCRGDFKRAEVLKDTYNPRWKGVYKDKDKEVV